MNDKLTNRMPLTALLLLRVWTEHGSSRPMRGYIRETRDVSRGFQRSSTVTDADTAVEAVRTWLQSLVDDEAAGTEPTAP